MTVPTGTPVRRAMRRGLVSPFQHDQQHLGLIRRQGLDRQNDVPKREGGKDRWWHALIGERVGKAWRIAWPGLGEAPPAAARGRTQATDLTLLLPVGLRSAALDQNPT
ncbi:hypothetical protein [Roseovarius sp. E0-M6]|uniref:hypothetical protein n=1 Tax=Roseovarius sp. E0-M6 TaxID=3127118 RepID=UPI00300F995A